MKGSARSDAMHGQHGELSAYSELRACAQDRSAECPYKIRTTAATSSSARLAVARDRTRNMRMRKSNFDRIVHTNHHTHARAHASRLGARARACVY